MNACIFSAEFLEINTCTCTSTCKSILLLHVIHFKNNSFILSVSGDDIEWTPLFAARFRILQLSSIKKRRILTQDND